MSLAAAYIIAIDFYVHVCAYVYVHVYVYVYVYAYAYVYEGRIHHCDRLVERARHEGRLDATCVIRCICIYTYTYIHIHMHMHLCI